MGVEPGALLLPVPTLSPAGPLQEPPPLPLDASSERPVWPYCLFLSLSTGPWPLRPPLLLPWPLPLPWVPLLPLAVALTLLAPEFSPSLSMCLTLGLLPRTPRSPSLIPPRGVSGSTRRCSAVMPGWCPNGLGWSSFSVFLCLPLVQIPSCTATHRDVTKTKSSRMLRHNLVNVLGGCPASATCPVVSFATPLFRLLVLYVLSLALLLCYLLLALLRLPSPV